MTKELIKEIAEWIIDEGWENTSEGNWVISFEEIAEAYKISVKEIEKFKDDILTELYSYEEVLEEIYTDGNVFDVNYCFDDVVNHATFFSFKRFEQYMGNNKLTIKDFVSEIGNWYNKCFYLFGTKKMMLKKAWKIYNNHLEGKYKIC